MSVKTRRKLIEVALPLGRVLSPEERKRLGAGAPAVGGINDASAREKSIRHGHPSTLHLWWARRPLAAARAVIFSQMVDDPSAWPERFPTEEEQDAERQRLFRIIENLVQWDNTTNEDVLEAAREEIRRSWRDTCEDNKDHPRAAELFDPDTLPGFRDPFCGGGTLPLEAQRLGLEAWASDLNPVAVLITKAMIEIPPKFAGRAPVGPLPPGEEEQIPIEGWTGAKGLAEDVRRYGAWMRTEAEKRIGHLYPKVKVTEEMAAERADLEPYVGRELTVIAWLWARTVRSPNPAFADAEVPLVSSFMLAKKSGKEAWVDPVIRTDGSSYDFVVRAGSTPRIEETVNRRGGTCLLSGTPMPFEYIRSEGRAGRMRERLLAIVAQGDRTRVYLSPQESHEEVACSAEPRWYVDGVLPDNPRDFKTPNYGITTFAELYTKRQMTTLTTFCDLVDEVRALINSSGVDETYANAIATYLALTASKLADRNAAVVPWDSSTKQEAPSHVFTRQAIPMVWDFAEANPFGGSTGNWSDAIDRLVRAVTDLGRGPAGRVEQFDAAALEPSELRVFSTDPPYYDNIGYADLSDFFYVWLRRSLQPIYPSLLSTLMTPKSQELVATPYRHSTKEDADAFFLNGMVSAMEGIVRHEHPAFPSSIYYAFKQAETDAGGGTASTGWETFLDAVIRSGFAIAGTWPMRTELGNRMLGLGANALASSIVLVCRPKGNHGAIATRRDFIQALKAELPVALRQLQHANIAPVDLAQSAIGPGMGIYTRYARVLDADGSPLSVHHALTLINQMLDEVLAEQEGEFDSDTRWAVAWFEQFGFAEGEFGVAETLSTAKNTSVGGMQAAGIIEAGRGKVRLLRPHELPREWDPVRDERLTVWEATHHLVRSLDDGEQAAADLSRRLGGYAESARDLAYRLFVICERKKRAQEALAYNGLVQSWPEIQRLAAEAPTQQTLGV